jgi:hypothetical protein
MRLHGIQMYVPQQRQKVRIDIHQLRPVTSLEQVPAGMQPLVPIARIALSDPLNDITQGSIRDLHQGMQVVGHPTESVNPRAAAINGVRDDIVEDLTVSRTAEQGFAMVAAQNDVVTTPGDIQSRKPGHPCRSNRKLSAGYLIQARFLSPHNGANWQEWQARHQLFTAPAP